MKDEKLIRFNLGLSPENMQYVKIMARASGVPATKYIDNMITLERKANKDKFERAKEFVQDVGGEI